MDRIINIFLILILSACTTVPLERTPGYPTVEQLLRAEPLTGAEDPAPLDDAGVLALSASMLAFLDDRVDQPPNDTFKLHKLVYAIIKEESFGLKYDNYTRTASEAFANRRGNCLSFTNMFVAMARQVGLDASFQEVDIPPDWTREGDTFVLNRHINVHVDLGNAGSRVMDFNIDDFRASYDQRRVPDNRALAHYYSNIGVERMQERQSVAALRYFRKAIESDDEFAPVWSNLGALYSRAGFPLYAEAAYVQALAINPRELVAMSNLGRLYASLGQQELADWYNNQTNRHRMRNPYYRYHLARDAFGAEDYDTAIGHLKYSVRKKKNEDSFYFLLGLSYLQKGDESAARRWLEKAEQVAVDDGLQRKYHSKLEMLLAAQK